MADFHILKLNFSYKKMGSHKMATEHNQGLHAPFGYGDIICTALCMYRRCADEIKVLKRERIS